MSEKKYIDAKLTKAEFTGNFREEYPTSLIKAIIDDVPAADVEEVKHGYWKICYYPNDEHVECSECHAQYYEDDLYLGGNEFPKRCPECGAHMDGGENE